METVIPIRWGAVVAPHHLQPTTLFILNLEIWLDGDSWMGQHGIGPLRIAGILWGNQESARNVSYSA